MTPSSGWRPGAASRRAPFASLPIALIVAASICAAVSPGAPAATPKHGSGRSASDPKPAQRLDPLPHERGTEGTAVLDTRLGAALELAAPQAASGDAWLAPYLADPRRSAALRRSLPAKTHAGVTTIRIPVENLSDASRFRVMRDLFPGDAARGADWVHRVGAGKVPAARESLALLARAYTAGAENAALLAGWNGLPKEGQAVVLQPGQEIVIPAALLHPVFARHAAAPPTSVMVAKAEPADPGPHPVLQPLDSSSTGSTVPEPESPEDDFTEAPPAPEGEEQGPVLGPPGPFAPPPVAEGAEYLTYGSDRDGRYAIYRLKRGEALYSAVVVRYTGRVDVQDVNDLAAQIARRNGISDVTNIPVGYKVHVPLDLLLPEYLPRDDERRQAWERQHAEVARYTNVARSLDLQGVAVILDAGHGGRDIGASHNGVWEHDYVYDILCRIKAILETRTRARVLPTMRDRKEGYRIHDETRLPRSQAEVLLTDPPFALTDPHRGVNLRWYLSNSYYRQLVDEGFDPLKIVFTSLHADARHPSLGGAMVYVPGEEYRRGRYGSSGVVYAKYREARQEPFVTFTRAERERSEGLSRQFGATLIDAFRKGEVAVHPYDPVRERIIRGGRSWVPAVLRCNVVPVEVLIEVSNLSNPADSRALTDPGYRQKIAEAYVAALSSYFGAGDPVRKGHAAAAGR